jgi:nicotinamidase-related amidase
VRLKVKQALLLVDIQNDYFPGGKMELAGSLEAGEKAKALLTFFRNRGLPVIHIQHLSVRPGAAFFLPDTAGVEFHETVKPREGETVFRKNYPNSFRQTPLLEYFRQTDITRLVIAGMMTHLCIDATTRAAFDLGFECLLAHDACAARTLSFGNLSVPAEQVHTAFVAALHGIFAQASATSDLLSTMAR